MQGQMQDYPITLVHPFERAERLFADKELATAGPGFAVDEDPAHLGESLVLPPWLEGQRAQITAALPPLHRSGRRNLL